MHNHNCEYQLLEVLEIKFLNSIIIITIIVNTTRMTIEYKDEKNYSAMYDTGTLHTSKT